jgi:branched-chain amino acid transport system substrate-binding protein
MAINDINAMLTSTGSSVRFQRVVADYALDTTKALAALNAFKAQGITVVVGPLNSGTASGILQVADSNQIVLISPSSTAPQLAIPNDYLFRTAPMTAIKATLTREKCISQV